ncbi:MAG: hypothetical protein ABI895_19400, partial [Deltaproteobacteria bacterium]
RRRSRRFGCSEWLGFGALLLWVFVAKLPQGLWEDGYFVKRFAYNFWHHGSFSWNVSDGPVYGMTSQSLQLLGLLLFAVAPEHLVVGLKATSTLSVLFTLLVLCWMARRSLTDQDAGPAPERRAALLPGIVGLSLPVVVESIFTGLETTLGMLVVALSLWLILKPEPGRRDRVWVALSVLGVYLTRPDAILIPGVVLSGLLLFAVARDSTGSLRERWARAQPLLLVLLGVGAGLAVVLLSFDFYYGTALPLPFYVKTRGLSAQPAEYLGFFQIEKTENALRTLFYALPFVYVALHARSRAVWLLLASALVFSGYHYLATIEMMGYLSRFYLPALVPVVAAAGMAYAKYLSRRRWLLSALSYAAYCGLFFWLRHIDEASHIHITLSELAQIPTLIAMGVMLLAPAGYRPLSALALLTCLLVGTVRQYPSTSLALENDETILLRQITPRGVFKGLERLRERLKPGMIYHTDMGAPGVLFPESKVVDLDGLLNEDITLRGKHFEELCEADQPEAIFVPNPGYARLRNEILASQCIKRYVAVTGESTPLYIRGDVLNRY